MKRLLIVALAMAFALPAAMADEGEKKNNLGGKKGERKKRERKKKDTRTVMSFKLLRLSKKNHEKVVEALKKMSAIAECTADVEKKSVEVKFESQASCSVLALTKALKKTGAYLDMKNLKLKFPCTIQLKGEMSNWKFDPKKGKKKSFAYTGAQKLLKELKKIEGCRYAAYTSATQLKLGMDREISFTAVAALIARYGSKSKGSGIVHDITWSAEKQLEPRKKGGRSGGGKKGGLK